MGSPQPPRNFLLVIPRKAKFVSCFRIRSTSLMLAGLWVVQAHAEPVSAQSTPNGPKTLLEAVIGTDDGNKNGNEDERLDPDRPHFPEATTAVGKDRAVLESGYTLSKKGSSFLSQSYPESLLRVGMFADWFEFRIGQNFLHEEEKTGGTTNVRTGAQDLYLGMKFALTQQKDLLPAIAVIPQMTVPTGSSTLTSNRVLPGLNVDMSWEIVKNFFGRYPERYRATFQVPSSNPPVKDRINCVNALLRNHAGQYRLVIAPTCKELIKDFERIFWKADPHGNSLAELDKSDPRRTHVSDAVGYLIARKFPMRMLAGERAGPILC